MVALKGKAIEAALAKQKPEYKAYLVYGPDQGLVSERIKTLIAMIVSDTSDPFNYMELTDGDLKADPSRLSDEITALSFMGGERVIRVRISGEAAGPAVPSFLEDLDKGHLQANGIVVIEAGDLSKRSGLRKVFDTAKQAASLPCYTDTPAAIRQVATDMATAHGLTFDNDALAFLVANMGEDRGLSRSELEKLMLYKSPGPEARPSADDAPHQRDTTITMGDVKINLVDSAASDLDDVTAACTAGTPGPLATALYQCTMAGTNPVTILRALQRTFSRLYQARSQMDTGKSPNDAMKSLRPPVFFAEQDRFRQSLNVWPTARLRLARQLLLDAELAAKTTGYPHREIVERTALQLCRMVRR